jgi:hypothetical protein
MLTYDDLFCKTLVLRIELDFPFGPETSGSKDHLRFEVKEVLNRGESV